MNVSSNPERSMTAPLRPHRFSLETYEAMVERGILTKDDRVELLYGEIVDVSPIGTRHNACVKQLNMLFVRACGANTIVGVQDSVAIPPNSEPQPDISVVRARADFYAKAHPRPADVLLLVEVAESSILTDRNVKVPMYARAGIPEVWIVDLSADEIEVYTNPQGERYAEMHALHRGEAITVPALDGIVLDVNKILPYRE